jgi:hypothetical protein
MVEEAFHRNLEGMRPVGSMSASNTPWVVEGENYKRVKKLTSLRRRNGLPLSGEAEVLAIGAAKYAVKCIPYDERWAFPSTTDL